MKKDTKKQSTNAEEIIEELKQYETDGIVMEIVDADGKIIYENKKVNIKIDYIDEKYIVEVSSEDEDKLEKMREMLKEKEGAVRFIERRIRGHISRRVKAQMKKCVRTMKVEDESLHERFKEAGPYSYLMLETFIREISLKNVREEEIREKEVKGFRILGEGVLLEYSEIKGVDYLEEGELWSSKATSERQEGRVLDVYTIDYAKKYYEVE